jgi:hypothetical protein
MDKEKIIPIKSIGLALAPNNTPAFLLDWEITKRCNLDCSYCDTDPEWGGHVNSSPQPILEDCLKSIDFMYEYVDHYMANKKITQRKVILNVYGGESLFHPNIVEILIACREKYKKYSDKWELTITTTTNAIIIKKIWEKIISLVDEFTVSYHAENSEKQEKLFFNNLLSLKNLNKRVKCVIMMHHASDKWIKSVNATKFCQANNIRYIAKPLDGLDISYSNEQFEYMKNFWIENTNTKNIEESKKRLKIIGTESKIVSLNEGRACCGGRKLSLNNSLQSSVTFVSKQGFRGWYCSVNWFFLFVQQVTGNVYTNKDCRTSLNSKIEPLGNLKNSDKIISNLKSQLNNKTMPVIQCIKSICQCGYCAPKAENLDDFKELINRNVITDVIKYD